MALMSQQPNPPSPGSPDAAVAVEENPIVSIGADVDVRTIVEEVKGEVRRKAEEGAYPTDLMMELIASNDRLLQAVEAVRNSAHVEFRPPARSNRPVLGTAITAVKWSIRRVLRFQHMHMAGEVNTFAGNVATALDALAERVGELEEMERALKPRTDRLERRVRQLSATRGLSDGNRGLDDATIRSAQTELAIDYPAFEDRFRGSSDDVKQRQSVYVELFQRQPWPVLDVGCGRGEFLQLLGQAGVKCYGVDSNPEMVRRCKEHGVDAVEADALDHLASLGPQTLGGVFSAQVVEHFAPSQLVRFFQLAARALSPGAVFVAETLNPKSLSTFTGPLYVDLGHTRPLHPLTLQFIAESAGFRDVQIRFLSPIPQDARLQELPLAGRGNGTAGESESPATENDPLTVANENFRRIDEAMFGPLDFAIVARM